MLPERVRAEDSTGLLGRLALDQARIRQNLTLDHTDTYGPTSALRLWPEAVPLRLGPHDITYTETDVTFDTPGPGGGGPEAYRYRFPAGADGVSGLAANQVRFVRTDGRRHLHQPGGRQQRVPAPRELGSLGRRASTATA